jgi:hypothetical protein
MAAPAAIGLAAASWERSAATLHSLSASRAATLKPMARSRQRAVEFCVSHRGAVGCELDPVQNDFMAITEHDLLLYARRVRLHFPLELRDIAEELAIAIAAWAGPHTKALRPETTLQEILGWMGAPPIPSDADSLDQVEAIMALEEESGMEFPDGLIGHPAETTFQELVQGASEQRAKS